MRFLVVSALSLALVTPVAAQQGAAGGLGLIYGIAKNNMVRATEQMPEEHFSFKPTPAVRSFGEIVGHVANANYMICSAALGEASPNKANFEKTTAKADLVQAIKDSFGYCDKAYQMADAKALEAVDLFGSKTNRVGVLAFNAAHDIEHYGNLVTYMRLKGLVPPSSQGQ